ncbi:peptidylprolyl isomerase [bacterium]|nr:peptidylprolyl isomerase [bacterium]
MNTKKLFATVAVSAMLLTGCAFQPRNTIIKVNDDNITQSQFDKAMNEASKNSMFAQMGLNPAKDKNNFMYLMLKDKVSNDLIVKSLIDQEMDKKHITVTKEDTDKELKTIMDSVGSKEKFDAILKQNGVSSSQFKKDLEEAVKMKKLANTISKVNVSDADARAFYNKNIDKFKYPDKVRASHILISASEQEITAKIMSDPANKGLSQAEVKAKVDQELALKLQKANKVLAEVNKNPADFAKLAKENSDDQASAKQGGDLGFFAAKDMVPAFSKKAFTMKPNTVSGIVKTPYGFHIIKVTDRMKAGQQPFEKVKPEIKHFIENQQQVKIIESLINTLKSHAKIVYVDKSFSPEAIKNAVRNQSTALKNKTAKKSK